VCSFLAKTGQAAGMFQVFYPWLNAIMSGSSALYGVHGRQLSSLLCYGLLTCGTTITPLPAPRAQSCHSSLLSQEHPRSMNI
jgi:hypothetical protein